MRNRFLSKFTLIVAAFTLGAILGRRWEGPVADGALVVAALATGVLAAAAAVVYWRQWYQDAALEPADAEPDAGAVAHRMSVTCRNGKWVLRLANIGRLAFVEVALALPESLAPRAAGAAEPVARPRTAVWSNPQALAGVLFLLGLVVYAFTRLVALDQFPIYFFADEAIEGVLASQLLQNGLRDYQDHLLPLFFNTYGFFNPLISVYVHVAAIAALGKSIVVTRGASAVMTLIGSAAAAGILRVGFKSRYWWAGVLFLAATPVWFLHSRTAFETAMMVSFYTCFLLLYILYRYRSPRFLYPALVMAAITFYSYGNGQLVIGVTGLLLLISDIRYHLQNWRTGLAGAVLLLLLAVPYYQFGVEHPNETSYHLRTLDTYWFKQMPVDQKIGQFVSQYAYGLSPQYWFLPNENDLARHRMKDYGNIAIWCLPFFLVGVGVCLARVKSSAHRLVLIAAAAAPIGGALTQIAITRVMAFVIPAGIFSTLGLEFLLARLRRPSQQVAAMLTVFVALSLASIGMFGDALANGPLWYEDYGLYGMQWGAKQLFGVISSYLTESPTTTINVTPTWANGTDVFLDYFMPNQPRVRFANVDALIAEKGTLDDQMIFVMTPEELAKARDSGKFKSIQIDRAIQYPNGTDGFFFARLAYADNVDAIFAEEKAERKRPVVEPLLLDGEVVTVSHPLFDSGQLANLFDNDTFTLVRVMEANPAVLEFKFPTPRRIAGLAADFGTMDFVLTATLSAAGAVPVTFSQTFKDLPSDPHIEMSFEGAPPLVDTIRIEINALTTGGMFKIHIRELKFK